MSTRDRVKLTAHERHQLAGLEAALETADPELAQVLRGDHGQGTVPPPGSGKAGRCLVGPRSAVWKGTRRFLQWHLGGPVLVLAGTALVVTGVVALYWLSVPGAAVAWMGVGLSAIALRRRTARRKPGPPPAPGCRPGASTLSG